MKDISYSIKNKLRLGVDVGSTTVKLVIMDANTNQVLFSCYRRHNAKQADVVCQLLEEAAAVFPNSRFRIAVCGSGGRPIADALGVHYIQEVVANAAAVRSLYPEARTAIELGGQDAKIVFFHHDTATNRLLTSDMRMNGSCAGGTGAFIDEIATLLNVATEEFEGLAAKGNTVYDISGRCGVFAKTDIQPLLIQGAAREDIALSAFHAIAKQTIGGLSQGLELTPPIIFEGGPLTFNPSLIRVFAERLNLKKSDIIFPEHPETIVALGTAIALDELFPSSDEGSENLSLQETTEMLRDYNAGSPTGQAKHEKPFFASREERDIFEYRHKKRLHKASGIQSGDNLRVYLGIDSGSTTSKIVLIDEDENVVDTFYSNNNGDPLLTVRDGLLSLHEKYKKCGVKLEILGLGTTGYGELLFAKAFGADYHTVETVAHAQSCKKYIPDVSFLLDIGGQDMKAIWIKGGVVTNILLNEACSSGCGSFLENFAISLGIPVEEISEAAFRSQNPAVLGSRCTVFMNSTIVSEQRNGKQTDDIMAGLCRSIVENVFTKVVRVSNVTELGDRIVVQGGTFRNHAVLRALEEYLGKDVTLASYPGEMGAIGAAISAKNFIKEEGYANDSSSSFIGFAAVEDFEYTKKDGVSCPICTNHCSRSMIVFSTGVRWVTGNRCERGAIVSDMKDKRSMRGTGDRGTKAIPDMFKIRNDLLFRDYNYNAVSVEKETIIGLPRVLEFWDSMPFWTTFFHALGFKTKISHPSSRKLYEQGLQFVASDTICFPAKLVHGHIQDLAEQGVDRIFMPFMMHMPPESSNKKGPYVCPIIMGYPMVVRNFESPESRYQVSFDTPTFHWFTEQDRRHQVCEYAVHTLHVTQKEAKSALSQAEVAIVAFRTQLVQEGVKILDDVRTKGGFVVVLAGRPYHTDSFICHDISHLFTKQGIPVLTIDSLPGLDKIDLQHASAEDTNKFHTRMLAGAVQTAITPELEYAQIVSFGCGHDAILSDEIIRIMNEAGGKPPLVLKVDESDATGSLGIRVQSFIETVQIRRGRDTQKQTNEQTSHVLPDPYPAKFYRKDKKLRTLLIPNISREVSKLLSGILCKEGFKVKTIPVGSIEQIRIGKKYTHNDICFPCQMVIGELISELQKGGYQSGDVAVGMAKFVGDCRLSHYAALLRKALDGAGFNDVPIMTTDLSDSKGMHPGVPLFGISALVEAIWTFIMLDILEDLRRKIRPYELDPGETNRVFDECLDNIAKEVQNGLPKVTQAFRNAIDAFCEIPYDRHILKPRVLVTGELLVTYHPGSNFYIENYLEHNGMETIFPRITNQFRKDFLTAICQIKDFKVKIPPYSYVLDKVFDFAQASIEKIAQKHPLYHRVPRPRDIYEGVRDIIPQTLSCGEGWLMAAEIVHYATEGVRSFVILQPFGCLPNHVCGRGVTKRIKDDFPSIQILPLDLDPDTSYANIENRLQMLIMNNQESNISERPDISAGIC